MILIELKEPEIPKRLNHVEKPDIIRIKENMVA
jgi:hypothetical protein